MERGAEAFLTQLMERYPRLEECHQGIWDAYLLMRDAVASGGMILCCGNGGSCADSSHIVGELLKGFLLPREIPCEEKESLEKAAGEKGACLAGLLQRAIPAIDLCANISLITAVANDTNPNMVFAQQLMAYSNNKNVLLGISPKGSAENIINAFWTARMLGIKTVALTGRPGNELARMADVPIMVPEEEVFMAQEFHLPIYHALCQMLETEFFGGNQELQMTT